MSDCNLEQDNDDPKPEENELKENCDTPDSSEKVVDENPITSIIPLDETNQNETVNSHEKDNVNLSKMLTSQSCIQCGKYEDEILDLTKKNNILNEQYSNLSKLYDNLQIKYDNVSTNIAKSYRSM